MDWELIRFVLRNVTQRRFRAFLTLLGVAIGIAAVVTLISLGEGLSTTITAQLQQLGSDVITVVPGGIFGGAGPSGGGFSKSLTEKDVDLIKRVKGVKTAIPMQSKQLVVTYKDESTLTFVSGFPPKEGKSFFENLQGFKLESGRWMKDNEDNAVVVGYLVTDKIFPKLRLRSKLEIEGKSFRVVGIMQKIGNTRDDTQIMMSFNAIQELLNNTDEVYAIMAQASGNQDDVAKRIEEKLDDKYGKDMFMAMTTEQIIERVNTVFAALSAVLAGIAAISLLVAGFGIMNTMLMSVLERTREIGIMKAIGATNFRILSLFLVESAIVGIAGGLLGIIMGSLATMGMSGIISSMIGFDFKPFISPVLLIGAVIFSAVVGSVSGLYPAWRASRLDPVEALRYE